MPNTERPHQPMPAEFVHYVNGASAHDQCREFDFLIGNWRVEGNRYDANGVITMQFTGTWLAEYLLEKRMVMDEFTVRLPSGQAVSSFVTLRTYSPITGRWELAGLPAMQPAFAATWNGNQVGAQMQLIAVGPTPDGRTLRNQIRFHDIETDRFAWESTVSVDDGATWTKVSSLLAYRTVGDTSI